MSIIQKKYSAVIKYNKKDTYDYLIDNIENLNIFYEKSSALSQLQIKYSIFNCRMILNNGDIIIPFNEHKFIQKIYIIINEINIRSCEVIFKFYLFKINFFFLCISFGKSNSGFKMSKNIYNIIIKNINTNLKIKNQSESHIILNIEEQNNEMKKIEKEILETINYLIKNIEEEKTIITTKYTIGNKIKYKKKILTTVVKV
jgi:hypothetical protein